MNLTSFKIPENRFKISRTLLQLEFLLLINVGPKEKKIQVSLVCGEKEKQECLMSYDRAAQVRSFLNYPFPPKKQHPFQTKPKSLT